MLAKKLKSAALKLIRAMAVEEIVYGYDLNSRFVTVVEKTGRLEMAKQKRKKGKKIKAKSKKRRAGKAESRPSAA